MRLSLAAIILVAGLGGMALAQSNQSFDRIERGRYLAVLGDCAACHTAPGGQSFAGGLALQTPFGKIVAPNITPDPETGMLEGSTGSRDTCGDTRSDAGRR